MGVAVAMGSPSSVVRLESIGEPRLGLTSELSVSRESSRERRDRAATRAWNLSGG
jgi:hypothetical protein